MLRQWRDEGLTPERIVREMAMDPTQVRLIIMTADDHPEEYEPAPAKEESHG